AAVRVEQNLVVHLGAGAARRLEAHTDLGALDGVDGAEGPRESAVELAVPLHVGAEADGAVEGDDFEDAPQGVACRLGPIDGFDHGALGRGIGATDLRGFSASTDLFPRKLQGADVHATDFRDVAQDGDPELTEDALGHARYRHAGGGLPRARALQHVADVAVPVLHGPRQIGVPRPGPRPPPCLAAPGGAPPPAMVCFQFPHARSGMVSVMGLPRVMPQRTPEERWAWSRSIFMRPPRP